MRIQLVRTIYGIYTEGLGIEGHRVDLATRDLESLFDLEDRGLVHLCIEPHTAKQSGSYLCQLVTVESECGHALMDMHDAIIVTLSDGSAQLLGIGTHTARRLGRLISDPRRRFRMSVELTDEC